jgi:hypothetical protein
MNSPARHRPEKISLFPACQPPPRLLKAKLVTEIVSVILNRVWPGQTGWRIEKTQSPHRPEEIWPGGEFGRRRATSCGLPRPGHKMQQALALLLSALGVNNTIIDDFTLCFGVF